MAKIKKVKSRWGTESVQAHQNTGEVITKPNQTSSVREILFRNTQGMTYDNYKTPYYEAQASFSSQALNKIQEMEPVEKLQYLKEVQSQVKGLQKQISDHEKAKQEALLKAQQESVVENTKTEETSE
jgi:hypothetical protein